MQAYKLYKRPHTSAFQVKFYNANTKDYSTGKSTGCVDRDEANRKAMEWLITGLIPKRVNARNSVSENHFSMQIIKALQTIDLTKDDADRIIMVLNDKGFSYTTIQPKSNDNVELIEFLLNFWDYEKSPYVQEKLVKGHSIHRKHCYNYTGYIKNYWACYFGNRLINSITSSDISEFMITLLPRGRSADCINNVVRAGTIGLKWAFQKGKIHNDCFSGIIFCSIPHTTREVLTLEQASQIFAQKWENEPAKLANMVALCSGMRSGEILALRLKDIGIDRLNRPGIAGGYFT